MKKLLVISSMILGSIVGSLSMAGDVGTIEEGSSDVAPVEKVIIFACEDKAALENEYTTKTYKVEVAAHGFFDLDVYLYAEQQLAKEFSKVIPSDDQLITVEDEVSHLKVEIPAYDATKDKNTATITNTSTGKSAELTCKMAE